VLPEFLAKFQALRDGWTTIQNKEIALYEQLSDALAQVDNADDKLDDFARRFRQAVLIVTGQSQKAALYLHFFKKPLHELIRPTLSGQLVTMEGWIKSLEEPTTHASLSAMLPELVALVTAAKAAEALRDDTKLKIKQFREVGERRLFIDQVNAARKELHGSLSNLALKSPNLASDFAQGFFKPAEAGEEEAEETIESVSIEIKRLEMALEEKRARLVELQKAADDAAEKAQKKAETQAKLDAINKEIEDKQKAAKALEDELKGA